MARVEAVDKENTVVVVRADQSKIKLSQLKSLAYFFYFENFFFHSFVFSISERIYIILCTY